MDRISKSFGSARALADVDLAVERGTVLALLGPNGAGKTTLVRILTTLLKPDGGRARVAGCDVVRDASRLRAAIGLAGQYAAVDELLTGRENLELVGLWYHLDKDEYRRRAHEVLEQFSLLDAGDRLVKTYSGGMRRRLDIGASLIARPRVLFLDEPTSGLDPRTRNDLWLFIEELVASGTTVLLTTQYMEEAERLADRIVVIAAFETADANALARVLREDAALEMTPSRTWFAGRSTCMRYLTRVLGAPADWRMTPTNANGQPAALAYRRSESGAYDPFAIVLLTTTTTGISRITLFGNTHLFARFALPQMSASASRSRRGSLTR